MDKMEMVIKVLEAIENGDDKVEMKFQGVSVKGYICGSVTRIDIKDEKSA